MNGARERAEAEPGSQGGCATETGPGVGQSQRPGQEQGWEAAAGLGNKELRGSAVPRANT